jgi:diguanylate cyclase (GGDEF)-like protein/PAS domain S-box-containing protein
VQDRAHESASGEELRKLREENAWLRAVLRYAGDILVTTDLAGRITEWSGGAEKILGWSKEEVLGRHASFCYVDPLTRRGLVARLRALPGFEPLLDQEVQVRRKDGRRIWLSLSLAALCDPEGRRVGTVGISKDITDRKRLERELRRLSRTDKLTGLYNQAHFFELLEVEKERAVRLGHGLVLVLFDLDHFKEYNDQRGHEAGDRVLRAVGGVIFSHIRKEVDSGFRYGGDEFCCLLPGTTADGGLVFSERIRAGIEALKLDGVTASIGLCAFNPADHALQLVKAADEAMYHSKRSGGNRISVQGRPEACWRRGVMIASDPAAPAAPRRATITS